MTSKSRCQLLERQLQASQEVINELTRELYETKQQLTELIVLKSPKQEKQEAVN